MLVVLSSMILVAGASLSWAATKASEQAADTALQRWSGSLLVFGLALLGVGLSGFPHTLH